MKWSACILIRDNPVTKRTDTIREKKKKLSHSQDLKKNVYAWKLNCFHITVSTVVKMEEG